MSCSRVRRERSNSPLPNAGSSDAYCALPPAFGSGEFDLSRLTRLQDIACPWQRPALDALYSVAMTELPLTIEGGDELIHRVASVNVTDDQTVWALLQFQDLQAEPRVARLTPGADAWSVLGDITLPAPDQAPGLFVRAGQVFANAVVGDGVGVVTWDGEAWQPLPDSAGEVPFLANGVSADASRLVGNRLLESGRVDTPWIRGPGGDFVELQGSAALGLPMPLFTSNDGTRVFGTRWLPRPSVGTYVAYFVSWPDEGEPQVVTSADGWRLAAPGACADDCRVAFGAVASRNPTLGFTPPVTRQQPWYWRTDGRSGVLGELPTLPGSRYSVHGAAGDANTVVGAGGRFVSFSSDDHANAVANPAVDVPGPALTAATPQIDGFVWMPDVGMTSVSAWLAEAGIELPDLASLYALAISPDGRSIFLFGILPAVGSGPGTPALALLSLEPLSSR